MNSLKNTIETPNYNEKIKEIFKELAINDIYDTWADTFEIDAKDEKHIIVSYHGTQKLKVFKKACKEILSSCIDTVMGTGTKVKIIKSTEKKILNSKIKKNIRSFKFFFLGMVFVCIAAAVIATMCSYIGNRNFRETFYSASSIKVNNSVRVIQLSDMHTSSYGKNNKKLLERINDLNPDIIICTGDIVDSTKEDIEYAVNLSKNLSKIAPSYYVYGNNEVENIYDFSFEEKDLDKKFGFDSNNRDQTAILNLKDTFEEQLENEGIKVLKNEKDTIKVNTTTIDIYGVLNSNPSSFWSYSENAFLNYIYEDTDNLKITAVHEPFIFEEFDTEFWGDIMICGHTHGGVMRVPVLGPLYTHEGGLFPERSGKFVYGRYNVSGRPLFVSAGLENSNVFRINNQPELVVIDINKF